MKKHENLYSLLKHPVKFSMLIILIGCLFSNCKPEDIGAPEITGVRILDPEKADSTFTVGTLGQMVAILGNNLESVQEVYFNSEQAKVNPNLATGTSIIVRIPSAAPWEVTNQIKVITKGGTAYYDFTVDIPPPEITEIVSQNIGDGKEAILLGSYFYNLIRVTFSNNLEGVVVSYTPEMIVVTVPEGTQSGPVSITTSLGTATSSFVFRDTTGMIIDFDDHTRCYGAMPMVSDSGNPTPTTIYGRYARLQDEALPGGTYWNEAWVFAACGDFGLTGSPLDYVVRFEINILEPWDQGWFEIKVEDTSIDTLEYMYHFKPWEDTDEESISTQGVWVTMDIPISEFRLKDSGSGNLTGAFISDMSGLNDLFFAFQNNESTEIPSLHICFDNVRIIKIR